MGEEIKEKIYEFLKKNAGQMFVLKELSEKIKVSYPSILKWSEVLIAERDRDPPVSIKDYGHIKLICVEKDDKRKEI